MRFNPRSLAASTVLVAAVFASVASTEENTPARVEGGSPADDTTAGADASPSEFVVGDLVALGDWQVRVHAVTDPHASTNEFLAPADGNRWVGVDVEVTNTSDEPGSVSSILCFEIMDDQNRAYQMTISGGTETAPDGEVAAGGSRRGTIVYEVPADATGLRLNFKCDLLSTGTATIIL